MILGLLLLRDIVGAPVAAVGSIASLKQHRVWDGQETSGAPVCLYRRSSGC